MFPLGLGVFFVGVWLVDSGVKNRAPLTTLQQIFRNPAAARTTLAQSQGTAIESSSTTTTDSGFQAGGGSTWSGGSSKGAAAIAFARAQIGKPYVWGATGPASYDCSGLVQASYKAAGVSLPRTTAQMILVGKNVAKADLVPGDLVFPDNHHVQIYTGGGNIVEAPRSGLNVREVPMWGFWRARRVA